MKTKTNFLGIITIAFFALCFVSCSSNKREPISKGQLYGQLYAEEPVTILVMPPINQSTEVEAKDYFYSTLAIPVANAGYYTYPLFMTLDSLQKESAYDAELFVNADLRKFNQLYGADLALFTTITAWDKHPVGGKVDVGIDYVFRSTKTNQVVYHNSAFIVIDTSVRAAQNALSGIPFGSLIGLLIDKAATAAKTAAYDYTNVARMCNEQILANDVPKGKYHERFGLDKEENATGVRPEDEKK